MKAVGPAWEEKMNTVEQIKMKVRRHYERNPHVRININIPSQKLEIIDAPAVITGVYTNIFSIEETAHGTPIRRSFQYSDILIGHVKIEGLD